MITLADAKLQLNIDASNTTHDAELTAYVGAAIRAVEKHTGQVGTLRAVAGERHQVCRTARLRLHQYPVASVITVARVDTTLTWDVADLDVDVDSGLLRVLSGPLFHGLLAVAYQAGSADVPENHSLAARIIVQHLWQTQRGAMASRGVRPALNDSMDNLVNLGGRGYAIPNAALELLGEPVPVVA